MKRIAGFVLLFALLLCASCAAAEEEMNWYLYWTEELGVNIGEQNGQLEEDTGVRNYVDIDGATSAIIGEVPEEDGVIWLKEEADGTSVWYGLDNSSGVFEEGSRFWVRQLSRTTDSGEWASYYGKLDSDRRSSIVGDHLNMFQIGVTGLDGEPHKEFRQDVPLYVQIDADWNRQDLHAAYIGDGVDEGKLVAYSEVSSYPEGEESFGIITLNHFSPYVIYEGRSMLAPNLPQTGDESRMGLWFVLLALCGAAGLALLCRRRENGMN